MLLLIYLASIIDKALAVYIALPSSKTIYILAGIAYVQEISSDIIEILKLKVKEAKKELEKGIK